VIGLPPFADADQLTTADPLPADADTPVGAPGAAGATGVTGFEVEDGGPGPTALAAITVNV
jgi:hypothetical protein